MYWYSSRLYQHFVQNDLFRLIFLKEILTFITRLLGFRFYSIQVTLFFHGVTCQIVKLPQGGVTTIYYHLLTIV